MTDDLLSAATLSQDEFDQAEAALIDMLRTAYPSLDLRRGTALRDLLVRPASAAYALETRRNDELLRTRSLADMRDAPRPGDSDNINAVLANLGSALRAGYASSGLIKVQVSRPGVYRLGADAVFLSAGGQTYRPSAAVESRVQSGPDEDGFLFFSFPAVSDAGAEAPRAGTAFTLANPFSGYVSAAAYADFNRGAPEETVAQAIERLPTTIATRGLVSRASIKAALTDPVAGEFSAYVQDLSIQGLGDPAQWRDRRNAHGVPTGGKIDIYARTFVGVPTRTLLLDGARGANGDYLVHLPAQAAPGYYAVKSVTDDGALAALGAAPGTLTAIGSYDFTVVDASDRASIPPFRLCADDPLIGTIYRSADIHVHGVPAGDATRLFKVDLYCAPVLAQLQQYVDRDDVRNVSADTLVRSPFMCLVSVDLSLRVRPGARPDTLGIRQAVADAVNRKKFGSTLTSSEILATVHGFDVESVDMSPSRKGGFSLRGVVLDGMGQEHTLLGPVLDPDTVEDPSGLLCRGTCSFTTSPDFVTLRVL